MTGSAAINVDQEDAAHSARYRLEVRLPPFWTVLDASAVTAASDAGPLSNSTEETIGLLREINSLPLDLVAILALPVRSREGGLEAVLVASLVSETIPSGLVPSSDDPEFTMHRIDGIEVERGRPASYVMVTHPVASADGELTSLLTFCSPNVPLAPVLDECFASIAGEARLVRKGH